MSLNIRVGQSLMLQQWLKEAEIDLAILQVFSDQMMPGDRELWREDLLWVQAADHPASLGKRIPFVSFDRNCFYRLAARQRLADSGRSLDVVLECPSAEGVRAGVRHGLGVALLNSRNLVPGLVEIGSDLPKFPQVVHVLRSRNGTASELERSLGETVIQELSDDS